MIFFVFYIWYNQIKFIRMMSVLRSKNLLFYAQLALMSAINYFKISLRRSFYANMLHKEQNETLIYTIEYQIKICIKATLVNFQNN